MPDRPEPKKVELKLDLPGMLEIARVGIRRASAFLKLGSTIAEADIPDDLSLSGGVSYQFWPNPVPQAVKTEIHKEFHAWLLGSCLKELDSYFSLFLDRAWRIVELVELHGKVLPMSATVEFDDSFAKDTNSFKKAEKVAQKIGATLELDSLNSLSRARNALTHGIGVVRPRDAVDPNDTLVVCWLAMDMVLHDGDKEIVFTTEPADMHKVESHEGAEVSMRYSTRSKIYAIGERLDLTMHELAEICMFYEIQAAKVHDALVAHLKSRIGPVSSKEA